jgi:cytochrome o ubiquinol oxidase subunit I
VIQKKRLVDTTGDPWNGRTLEWAAPSPVPFYNFTVIPHVKTRDEFWEMKQRGLPKPTYEDIVIPKNTAAGFYISVFAFLAGFAFVWEIIWLAAASIIGIIVVVILRAFNEESEYTLTAAEVEKLEAARIRHSPRIIHHKLEDKDEDMSVWELTKVVYMFTRTNIRNKRWRTW